MFKSSFLVSFLFFSATLYAQTITETVTVQASRQYSDPSFFKRLMLGKNYRKEWETPVKLPVFHLKKMGLVIKELGGGMQTKSLQMEDAQGKKWVLRSVEKDVSPNLPKSLQGTLAEKVVQDMISAAHPYAPLTIPPLASAIGILVPSPTFYYVPNDPDLGEFRTIFAHSIGMLEEREPTTDNSKTDNTADALEELIEENDKLVLQRQVLKARLLDMLIADWDRHADQWRWGKRDSGGVKWYYAIPRDRDQAYFQSNGLLVKIARKVALRHFVGYRYNLSKIKQLNFKSWKFDKTFINDLDKGDWTEITSEVQNRLTDNVVDEAMKKLPPEVYPISGPEMAAKLKNRRNQLMGAAVKYYDYISRTVTFTGTDEDETFKLTGRGDSLQISVFASGSGRLMHQRTLHKKETRNLVLIGLGGKDQFVMDKESVSRIRLQIDGGSGNDVYDLQGNAKATVTDFKAEANEYKNTRRTKLRLN